MESESKKIKYPENRELLALVALSGRTVKDLALSIGVSRGVLSDTLHGHYKGVNIIPLLKSELEK